MHQSINQFTYILSYILILLFLDGIKETGVIRPITKEIYKPVLNIIKKFGVEITGAHA